MTGIVLAAGIGSRLRPLTDHCPKCLLPVGSRPLLPRTLSALQESGIAECVLVTGYRHAMIEDAVRAMSLTMPVRFIYNRRYESTNNNFSLWLAGSQIEGSDILLLDADILFDPKLLPMLLSAAPPNALLVRTDGELSSEEIKVAIESNVVRRIGKTIDPRIADGESIGIEKFGQETAEKLFETLGRRKDINEFYEASFQELIDNGESIAAVSTLGLACMEIDTPDDLAAAATLATTLDL